MINKGYLYVLFALLILAFSHGVLAADPVGDANINNAYPNNQEANYYPRLSVNVQDPQNALLTIIFETNQTGTWTQIGSTQNGHNGVYTQDTTGMDVKNQRYYWRVRVNDGTGWTTNTYYFTAVAFALKWTAQLDTDWDEEIGPLAVDVNHDGIYEVFASGNDTIAAFDGATGKQLWIYKNKLIEKHSPFEMGDLNNDGIPEIIVDAGWRTVALHANDGSVYWDVPVSSQDKHQLILDTDGNHFPYVYIADSDVEHGENGTARLKKLNGTTGEVLADVFIWRPCSGGLSAADPDNSGNFIIYMCDRKAGYEDSGYYPGYGQGKGMQAYDAKTLKLLWNKTDITCSSHMQMLIDDQNGDGVMEAVAMFQSTNGGICIVNALTGVPLPGKCQNGLGLTTDAAATIYDIDNDGHLELITARYSDTKVWDLTDWKLDATLNYSINSPAAVDVIGDSKLEIVLSSKRYIYDYATIIYDSNYNEIERINNTFMTSDSLVQDIDNDGQNELILINETGLIKVYDTSAYAPTPRVRTNTLHYSERKLNAGVYVPLPGAPQPFIKEETPINGSIIPNLNPKLSFHAVDYRYDALDIDISTDASGSWQTVGSYKNVTNGIYSYTPSNMNKEDTTYNWKVSVVDSHADNITVTKLFTFNTAPNDAIATRPIIRNISPANSTIELPVNTSQISFDLFDNQNDKMNYTVTTSPDIGTATGIQVSNGHFVVPLHNVVSTTKYTWKISVTDGKEWRNKTFEFTTKFECVDADHDGYNVTGGICGPIDCNDASANAYPNAAEICGNGIDEDCNGIDKACLLSDSTFDASVDSNDLRNNSIYQDWYESRHFWTGGDQTLLTLDTSNIGGNSGKKALLKANVGVSTNAYLAQEFGTEQTEPFNVSFDIYIDSIDGTSPYDRTGTVYVGDDSSTSNCPMGATGERFVSLGFYDPTPGSTGNDLYLRAQPPGANFATTNTWINVTSNLNYDTWYNLKLVINPAAGTYDVYVNNVLKQSNIPKFSATAKLKYISFVADSDARGAFYVDNVKGSDYNNASSACIDADHDGYGLNCTLGTDCNDANPTIHPNALDNTCNNVDDNCNGLVDDGYVSTPTSCGVGACSAVGQLTCSAGVETNSCTAGIPALTDTTCNNIDENCNGLTDEGFVSTPTSCGVGECAATGHLVCTLGVTSNTCTAGTPATEICSNGLDDDCNGVVDNGCSGDSEWSYRKQITVNHTKVAGTLNDFPVLIDLSDSNVGAHAQSSGNDIYFTASDGLTKLSFEVESYSAGHLVAWVKVPSLSSATDTILYMYYGNPSASSQETPESVWDSNYLMVQHNEESSGTVLDSTVNNNDGTPTNGVLQNVVGKIDGADRFDGVDDITVLPKVLSSESQFTFEGWFFADSATQQGAIVSQRGSNGALLQYYNGNMYFYVGANNRNRIASSGVWHYVVGTYDGVNANLYVDTLAPATYATSVSWPNIGTSLGDRVDLTRRFKGSLDEIRISNVARSQAYVTTSFNNQNSPGTFLTLGTEEILGTVTCVDADGDGYNVTGSTCGPVDCNDASASINPGVSDATCNNVDDNCNGLTDEGYVSTPTSCGVGECAATGHLVCTLGVTLNTCTAGIPVAEICSNGLDDDCDGIVNNGCSGGSLSDWSYRKQITIDHTKVSGTLTDFPVLVDITDSSISANAQADGDDILFVASDGLTKLNFELESYSSGHVVAWVKVPSLSSSVNTVLYLYYDNPDASSQQNPGAVWDSNYLMVQHNEESSGTVLDSTINNNDGTPTNGVALNVVGKIDGADRFDGVDDITVLPKVLSSESQFTFEGWFFADSATQQGAIVSQRGSNGALLQYYNGNMYFYVGANNRNRIASSGVWHYVVGTYDGVNANLYVDTLAPATYATSVSWPNIGTSLGDRVDLTRRFKGSLDEIRISNVARSQAYVTTSYNNQNSPSTFLTLGTEELLGTVETLSEKVPKLDTLSIMSSTPTDNSSNNTPVEETVPVDETPTAETPVVESPVEETPVADTSVVEVPVDETPVEDIPSENVSVDETPATETPDVEVPIDDTPVEEVTENLSETTSEDTTTAVI